MNAHMGWIDLVSNRICSSGESTSAKTPAAKVEIKTAPVGIKNKTAIPADG